MRRFTIAVTVLGVLCVFVVVSVAGAAPVFKKVGEKAGSQTAEKGVFHATLTAGDRTQEFKIASKAVSAMRRISGRLRRAKDSDVEFKAVINVNEGLHEFTKPADAQAALQAVAAAMARARKAGISFGEIGKIEVAGEALSEEELKELEEKTAEEQKKALSEQQERLQAQRILRFRIQQAFVNEMQRSRGRMPDRMRLQQIAKTELDKAKKAGLISDTTELSDLSTNPAEVAKQAKLNSIRQLLTKAFLKADPKAEQGEGKPEEKVEGKPEGKAEEKPEGKTEDKAEEKAEGKPEEKAEQ